MKNHSELELVFTVNILKTPHFTVSVGCKYNTEEKHVSLKFFSLDSSNKLISLFVFLFLD